MNALCGASPTVRHPRVTLVVRGACQPSLCIELDVSGQVSVWSHRARTAMQPRVRAENAGPVLFVRERGNEDFQHGSPITTLAGKKAILARRASAVQIRFGRFVDRCDLRACMMPN